MAKIAFPRTMRNLDPGKLSSALAENMRYLENVLNKTFNFDHDILSNIGTADHHTKYTDAEVDTILAVHAAIVDDHHTKYTDAEVDTIVATHTAIAAAHHAKYLDSEVDAIVATHAAIAGEHHTKYLDSEAVTAMGAKADGNPLNHDQGSGITDHGGLTGLSDDDHSLYHTDARAVTWLSGRTELYLADGSRTLTGDLVIDEGGTAAATINMGDVDGSDDGAYWHNTKRPSDHSTNPNRLVFSEYDGTSWHDWMYVEPSDGAIVATRQLAIQIGSAAAPGLTLAGDLDSGIYRVGANRVGIAAGGTKVAEFNDFGGGNTNIRLAPGTSTRPAYSFFGDVDTGMWRFGTNELGLQTGGINKVIIGSYGIKAEQNMDYLPRVDNSSQLGTSALRYINVWALDGSINTSDEREKKDLNPLRFDARAFAHDVEPVQYRHKDGGKRWHVGFGARQIADAMATHNTDFGAFIDPSYGPIRGRDEEEGGPGPLGLRYHELLPVLWEAWKTTDAEVQRLTALVGELAGR